MLIAWLPLNCCCRLQAMFGMIDESHAAHHLCSHDRSGEHGCDDHPHPDDHDHDCGCAGHEPFAVRTAPVVFDDLAIQPMVIDLSAVVDHALRPATPVVAALWRDEARLRVKAGSSLLRHHCALTV